MEVYNGDSSNSKDKVIVVTAILVALSIISSSIGFMDANADTAMIWTDKDDYSPGETVTIYGSGFNANTTINITIRQPNGTIDERIADASDADGNFTAYYIIDNADPVGTYYVTATDGINTASTTFMDSPKVGSVSVSPSSSTVTAGNSTTYTITVNRGSGHGSSGGFSANLEIIWVGTQPSNVTFQFSQNPVSFLPSDNSNSSTLTIQTSTSTPANTYIFKVKATRTDNTSDSATSSNITLIVNPPPDTTPPVITPNISGTLGNNDWYVSDVTVSWSVSDPESGIASSNGCNTTNITSDTAGMTLTCSATNGAGMSNSKSVTIKRDATPPTINASRTPSPNSNGWNNTDVTVTFTCSDTLSGIDTCPSDVTVSTEGNNQSVSGTAYDKAGNSATVTVSNINIDKTPPTVSIQGISDGQQFDFGDTLPSVTCNATDNLSGIDGICTISQPLPTTVGTHTITATATDKAGNSKTTSIHYKIVGWTIKGFYQPVDNPNAVNTVKAGSTVPLKFEVFKTLAGVELTETSIIVQPLKAQKINCTTLDGNPSDEIELTATGGTSLRYDTTSGQFIYNWKTPTQSNTCWKVTVSTIDGSSIYAYFKLR